MSIPKIKGAYVPCKVQCGQPEPCFGCDSGDYSEDDRHKIFTHNETDRKVA